MSQLPDGVVLDEAASPGGALVLVAYEDKGTVWVGVRPKDEPLTMAMAGAIGLHTGSKERYLEITASIHGTWGVAFGAISPEMERAGLPHVRLTPDV